MVGNELEKIDLLAIRGHILEPLQFSRLDVGKPLLVFGQRDFQLFGDLFFRGAIFT